MLAGRHWARLVFIDSNEVPECSQALHGLSIKTRKQEQPVPHEENRLSRVTKSA
jgi:hypothetical protein